MNDQAPLHFIGVCGTAMGSIALALRAEGAAVTGSDAGAYPPMSDALAASGITVCKGYDAANLPAAPDALIVVGNAISRGNPELEAALSRRLSLISLPELLRARFLQGPRKLVCAGTHGKTTTASMLAWTLRHAGRDPNWLIGGAPRGLGSGARLAPGASFFVLEGDEYDSAFWDKRPKFLHYWPEIACIGNIEFDHADIYADLEAVVRQFELLARLVPPDGALIVNGDDANCRRVAAGAATPALLLGEGADCDLPFQILERARDFTRFSLSGKDLRIPMVGDFNARNAAMAAAAAARAGLSWGEIAMALAEFPGVARRQEEIGEARGVGVVDDFAHHPTAIRGAIQALRQRRPAGRIIACFEPRSATCRRRVHEQALGEALALADAAIIADVFHSQDIPEDERMSPDRLVASMRAAGAEAWHEADAQAVAERAADIAGAGDMIAIFSNGGFDGAHQRVIAALQAGQVSRDE